MCIMEELLHHFLHPHEPVKDCDTFMDSDGEGAKRESKLKYRIHSTFKHKPAYVIPTSNQNGINLNEFLRYDRKLSKQSDSPPPSYKSEGSESEVRSNDLNEPAGLKYNMASKPEGELRLQWYSTSIRYKKY